MAMLHNTSTKPILLGISLLRLRLGHLMLGKLVFEMTLYDLRAKLEQKIQQEAEKQTWSPPRTTSFERGTVLAIDPSLRATGIVMINSIGSNISVLETLVIKTVPRTGHEGNMYRACQLAHDFGRWLEAGDALGWDYYDDAVVVIEAPPVATPKIKRPESALLAHLALRLTAEHHGLEIGPMIGAQEHHYMCSGQRNNKVEAHQVLKEWAPGVIHNFHKITNEALRDALCVGLAYLKRVRDAG